jgi:hypothetical protein
MLKVLVLHNFLKNLADVPAELPVPQRGNSQVNAKDWYGRIFDTYVDVESLKTQVGNKLEK